MPRRAPLFLLVSLSIAVGAFVLWPSPIDARAWNPPLSRQGGPFSPNEELRDARLLPLPGGRGPESVGVLPDGAVVTARRDGGIVRLADGRARVIADTRGHPLGLALVPDGRLWVADAERGLLRVDLETGDVVIVATEAEGVPFRFTDGVTVASDGTVFFTDASSRHGAHEFTFDVMSARPAGRLLKLTPATGDIEVLLRDLYFANGVALSADESFLLVSETGRYRVTRLWLRGARAGEREVFVDALPGFPDNVTRSPRGTFWLALYSVRKPLLDRLHPWPRLKELLAKIPDALRPGPIRSGYVLELDEDGRVLRTLQDPDGQRLFGTTSALEHDGELYVGSLVAEHIGVLPLGE